MLINRVSRQLLGAPELLPALSELRAERHRTDRLRTPGSLLADGSRLSDLPDLRPPGHPELPL